MRPSIFSFTILAIAALHGCGSASMSPLPPDPLLPPAGEASTLTDVSSDLEALLEHGMLDGACARMKPDDRASRLLCGKSMFFYESFDTMGAPAGIVQFLLDNFAEETGPGFEKFGMIADPYSKKHLPLGLTPTVKLGGVADALAFTCASCHLGRLPDGRYSVGAPNLDYAYGRQNLALMLFPMVALGMSADVDPTALSMIQPLLEHYKHDPSLKNKLALALLPVILAGSKAPMFPSAAQAHYASWKSGTMDFLIEPLPLNDGLHTVSKISPLWELPTDEETRDSGMLHAMLGWTGGTPSLRRFGEGFVAFGGGKPASWPVAKLAPLVEYIYSLRRPSNPVPPDAAEAARGRTLFVERGCLTCHDGPRGSGKRLYTYDEIGTDRAMERWLDPKLEGTPCCNAPVPQGGRSTHAIKSPRIVGSWTFNRFLHNGAVDSLESLFCMNAARPTRSDEPFGDQGHMETCNGLSDDDKRALIAYLRAN